LPSTYWVVALHGPFGRNPADAAEWPLGAATAGHPFPTNRILEIHQALPERIRVVLIVNGSASQMKAGLATIIIDTGRMMRETPPAPERGDPMPTYRMVYGDDQQVTRETFIDVGVEREDSWVVLFRGKDAILRARGTGALARRADRRRRVTPR
jgi:hypothetical protein